MNEEHPSPNEGKRTCVAYYKDGRWFGYLIRYGDRWGGFTWHPSRTGMINPDLGGEALARRFVEDHAGQTGNGVWTQVNMPLPPFGM